MVMSTGSVAAQQNPSAPDSVIEERLREQGVHERPEVPQTIEQPRV